MKPSSRTHQQDAQLQSLNLIRSAMAELQSRNPSYSLRAFARKLQITAAELSLLLNGKRRLSRKMAARVFERLAVEPAVATALVEALPERLSRKTRAANEVPGAKKRTTGPVLQYIQLSTDEFRVVADWYHLAILSLAETQGFQSDEAWIARRLGLRVREVRSAVQTLVRLGLLVEVASGAGISGVEWRATGKRFTTTNDVSDASLRKNHAQGLDLARTALDEVPVELREFGASIIAIDPDLLPAAKARLRELRREVAQLLEGGKKKSEVYRLSVQLIPLTRVGT